MRWCCRPLTALLVLQAVLLGWSTAYNAPGMDEPAHLASGLDHWRTRTFDLYRVNPPLVRLVATAPLALTGVELPPEPMNLSPPSRPEFDFGRRFMSLHGERAFRYHTYAVWTVIPFALLATVLIYRWTTDLYGRPAGLLAAGLWALSPYALANGQMITPDTGAAAFGLLAAYLYRHWLREPGWRRALVAGIALGLVELCKTSWVILFVLWPLVWLVGEVCHFRGPLRERAVRGGQLATVLLVALYFVNAGYGFEGTGEQLGGYRFVSRALTTTTPEGRRQNRFAGTALRTVPVPLPRNYVEGIDAQKRDFESNMRS